MAPRHPRYGTECRIIGRQPSDAAATRQDVAVSVDPHDPGVAAPPSVPGRRHRTTRQAIEHTAFTLFLEKGFEETTVDDIATAASIGRRTFFRYFASKNDIAWGEFDAELDRLRLELAASPAGAPILECVRTAVVSANRYDLADVPALRQRITLMMSVPALQAHAVLRYAAWQTIVADFAAQRLGQDRDDLIPQAIGRAALGAALAAFDSWVGHSGTELADWLDLALGQLARGFTGPPRELIGDSD